MTVLAVVVTGCSGEGAPTGPPSSVQSYAQKELAYLRSLSTSNEFSGAVLVAVDGRPLLRTAVGFANRDSRLPNRPETRFRIGSITKALTAAAVMLLVRDGRLNLDDPACRYLASCPNGWRAVTVRNLLTHTSGIPDYLRLITLAEFNAPTLPAALMALVADQPMSFPPGSAYGYSNTNYVLLGLIIEHGSGLAYGDFLEQRIFGPLGMTGSGYARDFTEVRGGATGYGYKTSSTGEVVPTDQAAFSDGGLYSTVDDLLRLDRALTDHRLLPADLEDQMFSPWGGATSGSPSRTDVGLGWQLKRDAAGGPVVFHDGQIPGFSAAFERHLGSHVTAIVLSNFYWADTGGIASLLAEEAPTRP